MKKILWILAAAAVAITGVVLCFAGTTEFGDVTTTPRVVITGSVTAAGPTTPVTLKGTYSKWSLSVLNNGANATSQIATLQIYPNVTDPTPTFYSTTAAITQTSGAGRADTGTAVYQAAQVRVNFVLTPGPTPTPGATPGPTPAFTSYTIVGTN